MGNRSALIFDDCCEFEANNCLPITWLSLFGSQDFQFETRHEEDGDYTVAIFQTKRDAALNRIDRVINSVRGQTPGWAYLRPIEILKDELCNCSSSEKIEINATEIWATDKSFQEKIPRAAEAFHEMINSFSGGLEHDIFMIDQLANEYTIGSFSSIVEMDPEERMFFLFGTYWGDPEREDLYSLDYFNEEYWKGVS